MTPKLPEFAPMARIKLDKIDLKILRDLQESGRMTNVELAKNAGISPPPCLDHLPDVHLFHNTSLTSNIQYVINGEPTTL